MPGGYFSDPGKWGDDDKLGTAILSNKGAFIWFMVADAYALMCSLSVVFIHFMLSIHGSKMKYWFLFSVASNLVILAMVSMVVPS
ncbi:hypothetical protein LINPERHAP1_LOCUS8873 [Linum perenne]